MKKLPILIVFVFLTKLAFNQSFSTLGNKESTINRVEKIKQSTGQIFIDNAKSGTGFFISSDGIVVTNWHVVFNASTRIDSTGKILSNFSIVNLEKDTIPLFVFLNLQNDSIVKEAMFWDYCILKSTNKIQTKFLNFGKFEDSFEGATVYTCGYPLDLSDPFLSTGIISTFFSQTITIDSIDFTRQAAWLDMTTNKGNSGGALMLLGENPEEDKVIGLTSFITTPYYKTLEDLNNYINEAEKKGGASFSGINFLQYVKLINNTANSNSVGISGCISIEKVSNIAKQFNK